QGPGPGILGDLVVPPQGGEQGGEEDQGEGHGGPGLRQGQAPGLVQGAQSLGPGAQPAPKEKGQQAVLPQGGGRGGPLHKLLVAFFGKNHGGTLPFQKSVPPRRGDYAGICGGTVVRKG